VKNEKKKRSKYVGKNVTIFPSRKAPHQYHHICVDLPSFHCDMPIRQTRMGATTRARARPRTHLSNQARHKTSRLPHFASDEHCRNGTGPCLCIYHHFDSVRPSCGCAYFLAWDAGLIRSSRLNAGTAESFGLGMYVAHQRPCLAFRFPTRRVCVRVSDLRNGTCHA
jgi:hypothetical protein